MIVFARMLNISFIYARTPILALWSVKPFICKGYAIIKGVDDKMAQQRAASAHSAAAPKANVLLNTGVTFNMSVLMSFRPFV